MLNNLPTEIHIRKLLCIWLNISYSHILSYSKVFIAAEEDVVVKSLGTKTEQNKRKIKSVTLLGSDENLTWTQAADGLTIQKPASVPSPEALVFRVDFK